MEALLSQVKIWRISPVFSVVFSRRVCYTVAYSKGPFGGVEVYPYGDQNDREAVPASAGSGVYRNWILNSTRGDDRIRQYDEVESLVFSQCLAHGMAPLTELYQGS